MIYEIIRYPVDLVDPGKNRIEKSLDGIDRIYGMGKKGDGSCPEPQARAIF
jgi:hypothetical protein